MKADWKTTAIGFVMCLAAFILAYSSDLHAPKLLVDVAKFIVSGGLAALGIAAKDSTGTAPPAADKNERT